MNPCPFCKSISCKVSGKRSGNYKREGTLYYVLCNKCKARGPIVKCVDEVYKNGVCINNQKEVLKAIELWNKGR